MFIQTETTPNPSTVKFIPGKQVMTKGTASFRKGDDTKSSPLAGRILAIDGVDGVFFAADFISVTKADGRDWLPLKPLVLAAIMEHFTGDDPVVLDAQTNDPVTVDPLESEIVAQIRELIETRVRPAVAADGGDIVFHRFERGIVYLQMHGACAGCPSSTATLKHGIENMLRHYIPEVLEVRAADAA